MGFKPVYMGRGIVMKSAPEWRRIWDGNGTDGIVIGEDDTRPSAAWIEGMVRAHERRWLGGQMLLFVA